MATSAGFRLGLFPCSSSSQLNLLKCEKPFSYSPVARRVLPLEGQGRHLLVRASKDSTEFIEDGDSKRPTCGLSRRAMVAFIALSTQLGDWAPSRAEANGVSLSLPLNSGRDTHTDTH